MYRIIWRVAFVISFLVGGAAWSMVFGAEEEERIFQFFQKDGRYLLKMSVEMFGRDFLVVSRMDSIRGSGTYQKGCKVTEERVVSFRRGDGGVDVYFPNYEIGKIGMDGEMARLVQKTRPDVPVYSLAVVGEDGECVTMDMTEIVEGGSFLPVAVGDNVRLDGGNGMFGCTADRKLPAVYTQWVSENTEMAQYPVTTTFFLLRQEPWEGRLADQRVGYAESSYRTFAHVNEGVRTVCVVKRWGLEPKDAERYWRGELTEPKRPIVFYMDPCVPERWKPCFERAVEDWNQAFEAAGFRNAIMVKEIPDDCAYSSLPGLILFQDSLRQGSVDLNIDPRSGEIVQACVSWSPQIIDSVMREWVLRSAVWNDGSVSEKELEGEIVRATLGRRIGMALGLVDNQVAGMGVPVERLRDEEWLDCNGMSPSLMSEVVMNTVAQGGDGVSVKNLFNRVSAYDCWAINWGYRYWPSEAKSQEKKDWLLEQVKDPACRWYNGRGDESSLRPCASMDYLGDEPVKAAALAWRNVELQFAQESLSQIHAQGEWISQIGGENGVLYLIMSPVLRQIGGIEFCVDDEEESVRCLRAESKERQQEAVGFIVEKMFEASSWLSSSPVVKEAGVSVEDVVVDGLWSNVLKCLLEEVCGRMSLGVLLEEDGVEGYALYEMLTDLTGQVWPYLLKATDADSTSRLLCDRYLEFLGKALAAYPCDVRVAARACLEFLEARLCEEKKKEKDARRKLQLESYISKIEDVFKL